MEGKFVSLEFAGALFERGELFVKSLKLKKHIKMYNDNTKKFEHILFFENQTEIDRFERTYPLFFGQNYAITYHPVSDFQQLFNELKEEGYEVLN
jgi:hypothetical protein